MLETRGLHSGERKEGTRGLALGKKKEKTRTPISSISPPPSPFSARLFCTNSKSFPLQEFSSVSVPVFYVYFFWGVDGILTLDIELISYFFQIFAEHSIFIVQIRYPYKKHIL